MIDHLGSVIRKGLNSPNDQLPSTPSSSALQSRRDRHPSAAPYAHSRRNLFQMSLETPTALLSPLPPSGHLGRRLRSCINRHTGRPPCLSGTRATTMISTSWPKAPYANPHLQS